MFIDEVSMPKVVFVHWLGSWPLVEGGSCFFHSLFLVLPLGWPLFATFVLWCTSFPGTVHDTFFACLSIRGKKSKILHLCLASLFLFPFSRSTSYEFYGQY